MKNSKKNPNEFKCYCASGVDSTGFDFEEDVDMTGWDTSPSQQVNFKHAAYEPDDSYFVSMIFACLSTISMLVF